MTGPEHYRAAEAILNEVRERGHVEMPPDLATMYLRAAEVHASLAQTAAVAIKVQTKLEADEWRRTLGALKPQIERDKDG